MPNRIDQTPIQVWLGTKATLRKLADDLTAKTGRRVTLADTVDRAAQCLADSHEGKAWLNGVEAGKVLEERHRREVLNILGVLLPRFTDGKVNVSGMSFDDDRGLAFLHLADGDVMQMGYRPLAESEPVSAKG